MLLSPVWNILRRRSAGMAFLLLAAGALAAPWPHESGDVPPDPAIRWGRLENGLRYAIRQHAEPAGRVYLILQVAAGSVYERDDQLGYAHFVEHMMFRGTKKYPATSIVGFLQHEGLAMGADTSAFTNYTSTFYNLDLPHNTPEKISLGLSVLRDFADGALIPKAELKREGKVIESERRTRDTPSQVVGEAITAFLYPGSLLTRRAPIGTPDSVDNATAEGLQEFYRTWYRPSRMTIIAVGDADPALLEKLIRENFSSLKPATPVEPPEPDLGVRAGADDIQARFIPNLTPGGTTSLLYSLAPAPSRNDTLARRRQQVAESAGFALLNTRLAEIARKRPSEIGEAQAGWSTDFDLVRKAFVRIDTRADLWRAGVRLGEQELRRVLLHGFTADEVNIQVKNYRNTLDEAVRTAASRQSPQLAQSIRSALENNQIVTSPETDREILGPAVAALTPETCAAEFRAVWAPANRRLLVVGTYPQPLRDQEVRTAYDDSAYASFFTEQDARPVASFDYTDFGPPGAIKRRTRDERIETQSVIFANGVRANLKVTDYEKGRVYLRLRLGRGLATEPAGQPGLGLLTEGSYLAGGLGRYDNVELTRRLAGDSLDLNFSAEEEGFYFTGVCGPDKLEKLLQVIAAFITDPAFRPEGFQSTVARLQSYYPTVNREPVQFLRSTCPTAMAGGDLRYGLVPPDKIQQRQPQEVADWLKPVLAKGAIEIGLAGDLDIEPALAALSQTLGALPPRDVEPKPDPARKPALPAKSINQTWILEGGDPAKAAVRIYWPGVDDDDFTANRRLQVLAEILNDRLRVKIREELGATYGSQDEVWGSEVWKGYGYFFVEIETAPAMAERVAVLTRRIAADLAAKGITEDEFERVIQPRLASLKQELRNNGYWIHHVLSRMQENPLRVSWPLTPQQRLLRHAAQGRRGDRPQISRRRPRLQLHRAPEVIPR
ncbi:MAG: insulinase family protein [Lacunisphaera sp.]